MVGIDEVGRGCLAGPLLVIAARAKRELPSGLADSKLLSRQRRQAIFEDLITLCEFGEGWVKASEIDRYGLGRALRLGVRRALDHLDCSEDEEIVIDGIVNYIPKKFIKSRCVVKADNQIPIVSAASIYAKVTRDAYMQQLQAVYPKYGFKRHVGYGTKIHLEAMASLGGLPGVHRFSFAPLRQNGV